MSLDDQTLVADCRAGDKGAFEQLVKRHSPRVLRIIYRFFREPATAEDLAQDVFLKAYRSLNTYRGESPFENWLAAITLNTCYRQLAEQRRTGKNLLAELGPEERQAFDSFCLTADHGDTGDPGKKAVLRDLVEKILQQLSPKERMILTLMEVEGMTIEEIAHLWGKSVITVKVQAYRARKQAMKIFKMLTKTIPVLK